MTDTYTDADARAMGVDPQDPRWQRMVEHARLVEEQAPTVIPPCPSWCTEPTGHGYLSTDGWDAASLVYERRHVAFVSATGAADVTAEEQWQQGTVTLDEPTIYLLLEKDACTAEQARSFAAELLEAADVLDRIRQ